MPRWFRAKNRRPVTQIQLCAKRLKLGVFLDQGGLSNIEKGQRMVADFELVAIARCLKVSINWLCGQRGAKP
ncbi:MAG TPA: helix-turn-helix transcriptional regulator [Verrucomicrobiota bacterium]|nr:helix-turn-helix transcriptional regulator [Verrucomicrobiota bacterium]